MSELSERATIVEKHLGSILEDTEKKSVGIRSGDLGHWSRVLMSCVEWKSVIYIYLYYVCIVFSMVHSCVTLTA